jgi:AcrR family transcriptional regulator
MAGRRSPPKAVAGDTPRSGRPSLRSAQREFTRQLLLDAAVETFEATGYANATIDDIVTRANATRGTFYQYFSSKRDVATALLDLTNEKAAGYFETLETAQPLTRASVRAWLGRVAEFLTEYRTVFKALVDASAEDPELARRVAEIQQRYIALYERNLKPDPRHSSRVRAHLLEAQRDEVMRWWILEGWELDGDAVLEALADIWADAFGVLD